MVRSDVISVNVISEPEKGITIDTTDLDGNHIDEIIEGKYFYVRGLYTENGNTIPNTMIYLYHCSDSLCNEFAEIDTYVADINGQYVFQVTSPIVDIDTSLYLFVSDVSLI